MTAMRVMLVHNYVRPPAGDNNVFENERNLLKENGVIVSTYERNNVEIEKYSLMNKIKLPWNVIWSNQSHRQIKHLIRKHKPSLVHFHNTFPLISPSAYYACKEERIAVIQTLHNHRLFCPTGIFLRDGKICKDCVEKNLWSSVRHACYHSSNIQSAGISSMIYCHRKIGTYEKMVDYYIALSNFAKDLYSCAGLPKDKIVVKPNFIMDLVEYRKDPEHFGIFIGRLSEEKGLELLFHALKEMREVNFKIIGDGPQKIKLDMLKNQLSLSNVELCGYKTREETLSILGRASFLVLPSIWYEGFPMVILEAMSLSKPVITSNLGGLPEFVTDGYCGFTYSPQNLEKLSKIIDLLYNDNKTCRNLGLNARKEYEEKYTPKKNFEKLKAIYNKAIEKR